MSAATSSMYQATLQFRQPGLEARFRGAAAQNALVFDRWFYAVMLLCAVTWIDNCAKQDCEPAVVDSSNDSCPAALRPIYTAFGPIAAGLCSRSYSVQAALVASAQALLFCVVTVRSFADVSAWCCPSFYVRHRVLIAIVSCSCDMLYCTMHRVVYCVFQATKGGCSKTKLIDPMLAIFGLLYRVPLGYVVPCFSLYCVTHLLLMQRESVATGLEYSISSYAKAVFWQAVVPVVTAYVLQRRVRLQYLWSTAQHSAQQSAANGPAPTKHLTWSVAAKAAALLVDDDQASSSSCGATTPAWSGSSKVATAAAADTTAAAAQVVSSSSSGLCLMYESPLVHQTIAVKIKSHSGAQKGDLTAAALAATIETVLAKLQYMSHAAFVSMPVCVPSCTLFLGNIIGNAIQRQQQQGLHVPCVHDGTWNVLMRPSSSSSSDSTVDSSQKVAGSSSTDPSSIHAAPLVSAAAGTPGCILAFDTYEDFQAAVRDGSLQASIDQLVQQQPAVGSSNSTMCLGSYAVASWGDVLSCNLLTPAAANHLLGQQLTPGPPDSSSSGSGSGYYANSSTSGSGSSTNGGGSSNDRSCGSNHGSSSSGRADVVDRAAASAARALHRVVLSQGGAAITDQHIQLHHSEQHPAQWEALKLQLQLPCSSSSTTTTTISRRSRTSSSSDEHDDHSVDCSSIQQLGTCTVYVSTPLQPDTGQHRSKMQQEQQHAAAAAARSPPLAAVDDNCTLLAAVHVLLLPPAAAAELTSWLQQTGLSQQQVEPLLLDMKIAVDAAIRACTFLESMATPPAAATLPVAGAADSDLAVEVRPAVDQEKDRGGFVDWATAAGAASRAQHYLHTTQLHCCSSILNTIVSIINKACPAATFEQPALAIRDEMAAGTAATSTAAAAATEAATTKVPAVAPSTVAASAVAPSTAAAAAGAVNINSSRPDAREAARRHLPAAAAATSVDPSLHRPHISICLQLAVWCGLFAWWGIDRHLQLQYTQQYKQPLGQAQVVLLAVDVVLRLFLVWRAARLALNLSTPSVTRPSLWLHAARQAVQGLPRLWLLLAPPQCRRTRCLVIVLSQAAAVAVLLLWGLTPLGFSKSMRVASAAKLTNGVTSAVCIMHMGLVQLMVCQVTGPWQVPSVLAAVAMCCL